MDPQGWSSRHTQPYTLDLAGRCEHCLLPEAMIANVAEGCVCLACSFGSCAVAQEAPDEAIDAMLQEQVLCCAARRPAMAQVTITPCALGVVKLQSRC